MARVRALLLSLLVTLLTMFLVNCSPYSCRVTFGNSTCNASGGGIGSTGGGGGGGGGGGTIDASTATSLVYYSSSLKAAGFGGTTFLPLTGYTAPTIPASSAVQMTIVNQKYLYQPMGDSTIQGFSIDRTTGLLTAIPGSPFSAPGGATADGAWSDPAGKFLFVGSEGLPAIWAYTINSSTGALTLSSGSPFVSGFSSADIMTVDASGKFLYVGMGDPAAGIAVFSIDSTTGNLTVQPSGPFGLNVAQIHASPTSEFLLGVAEIQKAGGSAIDPHIHVFSINPASGIPTEVGSSPILTSAAPFEFAISPNGDFVYSFGVIAGTGVTAPIEGFSLDGTGTLTSLGTSFSSLPTTAGCQFDQSGNDMFCINALFGTSMFVLDADPATGALTHAADLTVSPSNFPFAVTD